MSAARDLTLVESKITRDPGRSTTRMPIVARRAATNLAESHAEPQKLSWMTVLGVVSVLLAIATTIGFYQPSNLLHIVLDNQAHDSTGGQQTASGIVRFAAIAAAANYRSAFAVDRAEEVREAVRLLRQRPGPSLLHVKIQPGSPEKLGRPTAQPHEVKERFSQFLSSKAK